MARAEKPTETQGGRSDPLWYRVVSALTGPWTRSNGMAWLKLIVFILVFRWGFVELYSIPSASMEPTLHGDERFLRGDYVAVNKLSYGPRVPFTKTRLIETGRPKRWDVVVFDSPDPEAEHPILIKRLVGLPGERVHIEDGALLVDGEPVDVPERLRESLHYTQSITPDDEDVGEYLLRMAYVQDQPMLFEGLPKDVAMLQEDLAAVRRSLQDRDLEALSEEDRAALLETARPQSLGVVRQWLVNEYERQAPFRYAIRKDDQFSVIPEGHYLMLGDNSGNSVDGRYFGWVPFENLYGRAFAVALPFTRWSDLSGFTDTWIGLALLIGSPLLLLYVLEVRPAFVSFSWRVHQDTTAAGLQAGEHIIVNRIVYGLRRPFSGSRIAWRATPAPGEVVAFVENGQDTSADLAFGRVESCSADGQDVRVHVGDGESRSIARDHIVGRVQRVWWPASKARRLTPGKGESTGA